MENQNTTIEGLDKVRKIALPAGIVGLAICLVGFLIQRDQFFQSYLLAYILIGGMSLGSLSLLLIHQMFAGSWGYMIQSSLEAGAKTLPVFAVLGLPILAAAWMGLTEVYPWTNAQWMAETALVARNKVAYLNVPFFTLRYFLYFAIWIAMMLTVTKWSKKLDQTGDGALAVKLGKYSTAFVIIFGLTITLAATDWVMSIEPDWFSTIFGALTAVSQGLTVLAFSIIVLSKLADHKAYEGVLKEVYFHHLGNLLLGFTVLWAYMSFSQFLIIWNANIPEEIAYYVNRSSDSLNILAICLMIFHFFIPFYALLFRHFKKHHSFLRRIAYFIIAVRLLDMQWHIMPSFNHHHQILIASAWEVIFTLSALVGLGGIWLYLWAGNLKSNPLVPARDPRMEKAFVKWETLEHHG